MRGISLEWANKAEGDFATALREFAVREDANYDAVCFHAQQCAEKYLKAALLEKGIAFGKVHDLEVLLDVALDAFPIWESFRAESQMLTQYAVQFRYPGESADKEEAAGAVRSMKTVRGQIREGLGLEP
jgi:HEPN domain-containing protein